MKNIITGFSIFISMIAAGTLLAENALPRTTQAKKPLVRTAQVDNALLRLYTDRDPGDTKYYVINPANITYFQWDEDDKYITIITPDTKHGESKFMVYVASNEDAEKFIEIVMGIKADRWLDVDHK